MTRSLGIRSLKRGLLFFWAAYFTLVCASNAFDALKALGVVGPSFAFASGNYAMIVAATAKFAPPAALNVVLFAGVIAWQALSAVLLFAAFARVRRSLDPGLRATTAAFVVVVAHWAAFVLAEELFIAYESGVEAAHIRLFIAALVSLLAIHLLPDADEKGA